MDSLSVGLPLQLLFLFTATPSSATIIADGLFN